MTDLTESLKALRGRIQAAALAAQRPPGTVALLAVSKAQPVAAVRTLAAAGQHRFGENRVQEADTKIQACRDLELEWHFIGHLQTNKSNAVAAQFAWVHSLDRLKLARRLNEQRPREAPPLNVCLQVCLADEPGKSGVHPEELPPLARAVAELPRLRLRGLMCIPPPPQRSGDSRPWFRRLRQLLEALNAQGLSLDTLSMGMSADLEEAIAEGATVVRVGTALFGPRQDEEE